MACHTLFSSALSGLAPGDTVFVCPGTYRQKVGLFGRNGTASTPIVFKAVAACTLDGADDYSDPELWSDEIYPGLWTTDISQTPMTPPSSQVFIDGIRYLYESSGYSYLNPGEYTLAGSTTLVVYTPGGFNPGTKPTYVGQNDRNYGFSLGPNVLDVPSTHIVIDGFTLLRTAGRGIDIVGNGTDGNDLNVTGIHVKNCTSALNYRQGIRLRNGYNCTIEGNTTYGNGSHGVYMTIDSACVIIRNNSYANNEPYLAGITGDAAGFKIGDAPLTGPKDVREITLDYNVAYDNEDTGFNVKSAKRILLRRNVSYENGDHGYDNLNADEIYLINNVAARNDHNGISIESGANNVEVYNCVLAHNAQYAPTLEGTETLAEMWVDPDVTGFQSDHNVLIGQSPHGVVWLGEEPRGLVYFGDVLYDTLLVGQGYLAESGQDAHSRNAEPMFVNEIGADFMIGSTNSPALERATTNVECFATPCWLEADPRGFLPHDNDGIPNAGDGDPAHMEAGAYEYDVKPQAMTEFSADVVTSTSIHLKWVASGDDGMVGRPPAVDLRWSQSPVTEQTWAGTGQASPQPSMPVDAGSWQGYWFTGLPWCTLYYFGLKYGGGNGLWADLGDTVRVVTAPVWQNGHWACDDEGLRAQMSREDAAVKGGGAGLGGRTITPLSTILDRQGNALVVEVIPRASELELTLTRLPKAGAAGVIYQTLGDDGEWTSRLEYQLPTSRELALLVPDQPGRWVFLDSVVVRGLPSTLAAAGRLWQLEVARHSRLGDFTSPLSAGAPPAELIPGDTINVRYTGLAADVDVPPWLVLLGRPATGTLDRATPERLEGSLATPAFALHQNQPNPLRATTTIAFDLPRAEMVRLELFDLMGRRVATLRDSWMPAGRHSIEWNRLDAKGSRVREGAYVYRLQARSGRSERKLVVLP